MAKVALPLPLPPIPSGPDGQIPAMPAAEYSREPTIGWPIAVQQSARKFPSIADNRQDALRPRRDARGPVPRPCILRSIPESISLSVPHLSPPAHSASRLRARDSLDITVPTGMHATSEISLYDISSNSRMTRTSRKPEGSISMQVRKADIFDDWTSVSS